MSYGFSKFRKTESPVFSACQVDRYGDRSLILRLQKSLIAVANLVKEAWKNIDYKSVEEAFLKTGLLRRDWSSPVPPLKHLHPELRDCLPQVMLAASDTDDSVEEIAEICVTNGRHYVCLRLFGCRSIRVHVYPGVCLSECLSIRVSVYLSVCLSVWLSIRVCVYLGGCLSRCSYRLDCFLIQGRNRISCPLQYFRCHGSELLLLLLSLLLYLFPILSVAH